MAPRSLQVCSLLAVSHPEMLYMIDFFPLRV